MDCNEKSSHESPIVKGSLKISSCVIIVNIKSSKKFIILKYSNK